MSIVLQIIEESGENLFFFLTNFTNLSLLIIISPILLKIQEQTAVVPSAVRLS